MPYAIKKDGAFRATSHDMELLEGETNYEDVPQWVWDRMESDRILLEQTAKENTWRVTEVAFITDQLIGMEDGDPNALPGTEEEWRSYRTKVRAWKEGGSDFPNETSRPSRPT